MVQYRIEDARFEVYTQHTFPLFINSFASQARSTRISLFSQWIFQRD